MYHGERFNSISHLVGSFLALVGLSLLVVFGSLQGDPWKIVSFSVYGASLLLLYAFSSLYHSIRGPAKRLFQTFDHLAIYLLIAGTYTPFTLVTLRGPWGWSLFGAVWGLALLGILLETRFKSEKRILPVVVYIGMGWLIAIAFKPLLSALPPRGITLLVAGGLLYSVGVIFYALDKKVRHFHGIWHLFVLGGSICHYLAIFLDVL
ncbi:hemolysin III family protein [Pelagicoccus sp. SDUM812003]|uniref:PAQR family membrane homeostasis protein TrhA n=1 Tax=Pelagicoccus sp. SDUM812003 TaxID=3041267 RepID=UPI00280D2602|nr:hemolysin III family protein [Pelagicoccus sp. SDUM812003]MDQ8203955.1 hemolysin III family protein [Pelagicoccus sp. SDUM812003]